MSHLMFNLLKSPPLLPGHVMGAYHPLKHDLKLEVGALLIQRTYEGRFCLLAGCKYM